MAELYLPNLDDEELLRVAGDSTDPLVEELVKRLAEQLDDKVELEGQIRDLNSEVTKLTETIDRSRGLKD